MYIKTISMVFLLTILSSLLGFVREIQIAKHFGIDATIDSFVLAYSIISCILLIFNPATIQATFMPLYQKYFNMGSSGQAMRLFLECFRTLMIILTILSMFIFFFGRYYIPIVATGFDQEMMANTIECIKILTPLILLLGITSLLYAVCNAHNRFLGPLVSQVITSVTIILFLSFAVDKDIIKLSWYFLIGSALGLVVITFYTLPYLQFNIKSEKEYDASRWIAHSLPLFIFVVFEQIGSLIQKVVASSLDMGSVSSLYYVSKLTTFPVNVFAASISTVFFPSLVNMAHTNKKEMPLHVQRGFILVIYCLLPICVFFILNADNIIYSLFLSDSFDLSGVEKTRSVLFYYSFSILTQGLLMYLNKIYFALEKYLIFLKLSLIFLIVHVLFCYTFSVFFGVNGIALAFSISSFINVIILIYCLKDMLYTILDYKILIKPLLAASMAILCFTFFQNEKGLIFLIRDAVIISAIFVAGLFLLKDKKFNEVLFFVKR